MTKLTRAFCVSACDLTESQVDNIYNLAVAFDNVEEFETLQDAKGMIAECPYLGVDYAGDILTQVGAIYFLDEDRELCRGLTEESILLSYDEAVSLLRTGEKAPFVPANDAPPEPVNIVALAVSYDVRITVEADGALGVYLNDTEYLCKTPEQLVDLLEAYDHMKQHEV